MNIEEVEKKIHRMVNKFKEEYFILEPNVEKETFFLESFEDLRKIKEFIEKRLKIKNFPPLLSQIYINNRKKMIAAQNQNAREIRAKVQCLKENNNIFIDPNQREEVIGFNNIPFIHFKHIGIAIGDYKITIPEELPFGILLDYEAYITNNFDYEDGNEVLEIIGTPTGDVVQIIEDRWINAPGDIDNDNDQFDSLINTGPQTFNVQFYTGEITLRVTGNFGMVSYYIKDKGYMGGQKRLKFSEICLRNE